MSHTKRLTLVLSIVTLAMAGALLNGQGRPAADPLSDGASNVRLVGYNDLQGREALVVTTKSDPANGSWAYVGHHESYWDNKPKPNPIPRSDNVFSPSSSPVEVFPASNASLK